MVRSLVRLVPLFAVAALVALGVASTAQADTACHPPKVAAAAIQSLHESNIGCARATELVLLNFGGHSNRLTDIYHCTSRISGRHVSQSCVSKTNHTHKFSASWQVH